MPLSEISNELIEQILKECRSIENINFSNNRIQHVYHLNRLKFLKVVNLNHNRVCSLQSFTQLENLVELHVAYNQIESLVELKYLPNVQMLNVMYNNIQDGNQLQYLRCLKQLQLAQLLGNPVTLNEDSYKKSIRLYQLTGKVRPDRACFAKSSALEWSVDNQHGSHLNAINEIDHGAWDHFNNNSTSVDCSIGRGNPAITSDKSAMQKKEQAEKTVTALERTAVDSVSQTMVDEITTKAVDKITQTKKSKFSQTKVSKLVQTSVPNGTQTDLEKGGLTSCRLVQEKNKGNGAAIVLKNSGVDLNSERLKVQVNALQNILEMQEKNLEKGDEKKGLLSRWRNKVFELLLKLEGSEILHRKEMAQCTDVIRMKKEECSDWGMKMKISGEKCRHMIAKYESAMVENKMLELSNQEASGENRKIANALRNERNHIAQLADHVGYIFHDDNTILKYEETMEELSKLQRFEERLTLASSRLEMLSKLLQRNDVRLRNERAALEAEKRVWVSRLQQCNCTKKEQKKLSSFNKPIVRGLYPDCEAALRMVFHRLDYYKTGLVDYKVYFRTVQNDINVTNIMARHFKLTKNQWKKMLCLLQTSHENTSTQANISWGEFLLLFMPRFEKSANALHPDNNECQPLIENDRSIPPEFSPLPESTILHQSVQVENLSIDELRKEVSVLYNERNYLISRLQHDARALQDRAMHIRCQWQQKTNALATQLVGLEELRTQDLTTIERLELNLAMQQSEIIDLGDTKTQIECDFDKHKLKAKLEMEQLHENHAAMLHQNQIDFEDQLEDARRDCTRLKKENATLNAALKHTQQKVDDIQEEATLVANAKISHLEEILAKSDQEIAKLRREKNSLLATMRDLEKQPKIVQVSSVPKKEFESKEVQCGTELPATLRIHISPKNQDKPESLPSEKLNQLEALTQSLLAYHNGI